ncbi:hypothetical protein AMTR_s00066p00196590 [Amborella trichopoda]|uniref:Uncharacterized protein n=1 Tax=Amborella trichopoda TaxID=13333 RepID=U5D402_AMBTC|nr:hypothetical protein AMTR_s00066p00196590 [Amborella trichopoda]
MSSGSGSPSSSPPTPPSPLPISVGPNHEKYIFSSSPSPSPPFSPTSGPLSSESDSRVPESLALLPRGSLAQPPQSSTFSLDRLTDSSTAPNSCFWNWATREEE